jgi:uncharacterized protein (DUF2164 family)
VGTSLLEAPPSQAAGVPALTTIKSLRAPRRVDRRAQCVVEDRLEHCMIELPKDARQQAIASIERYFREHMDEPIGNIAAGGLLGFFVEEIGPVIYNQAVADVQERLQARIAELDIEVHEEPFEYWRKFDRQRGRK